MESSEICCREKALGELSSGARREVRETSPEVFHLKTEFLTSNNVLGLL
jgi:hypothetical protein